MFEVGDIVPLSVQTFAADGITLADANPPPTVVITKPDRTVTTYNGASTPAVTRTSLGTYELDFPPAASGWGLYRAYWDAAGTQLSAYTDAFLVVDGVASLLIGLTEARAAIRNPGQSGSPAAGAAGNIIDEDLRSTIAAARAPMEDLVGPIIPRVILGETQDGGSTKIILNYAPVLQVTSVKESAGNYVRSLTAQPLDGASFDAYGYTLVGNTGTITRRTSGAPARFVHGTDNVLVDYVAGRAIMGANLQQATQRLVRWLWQSGRQGQRPSGTKPETVVQTPSGYDVPLAVKRLCADDLRVHGMT